LIRVAYAGVNYAEVLLRSGAFGAPRTLTVPGLEVSGEIVEVGDEVRGLHPGDRVAALTHASAGASGGYAEYAVVPATLVYPLQTAVGEIDLTTAAALPCMVTTAHATLCVAHLEVGETVLVHAAAGGVGSVAAQVARAMGAGRVVGTVGRLGKIDLARAYGYDQVYLRDGFASAIKHDIGDCAIDVILDSVSGPTTAISLELLGPLGRLAIFGNPSGGEDVEVSTHGLWLGARTVVGYNIGALAKRAPDVVRRHSLAALELLATRRVRVDIADVVPLERAAEVHERLQSGASNGKFLLEI
jgi:NADPH2:quinone reductase